MVRPARVQRLNREINAVLSEPAIKSPMTDLGSDPLSGRPPEFAKFIAEDVDKLAKVVKAVGLKID
jgi:tripartite-type tricarboxylate transporter receptor subunit TctC